MCFGAATHTMMDNGSPAHRDFQVYDVGQYGGSMLDLPNLLAFQVDMEEHTRQESRQPTQQEMNQMVDEMRLRFYEVYGDELYQRAVPDEERDRTAERLGQRGTQGMLYSRPPQ